MTWSRAQSDVFVPYRQRDAGRSHRLLDVLDLVFDLAFDPHEFLLPAVRSEDGLRSGIRSTLISDDRLGHPSS
jgi:hypothetical protein